MTEQIHCANCGQAVTGRFCKACGTDSQSDTLRADEGSPSIIETVESMSVEGESTHDTSVTPQSAASSRTSYQTRILFGVVLSALLAYNAASTLLAPYASTASGGGTCGSMLRPMRYNRFEDTDPWLGWMWGSGDRICAASMGAHQSEFWVSLLLMAVALGYVAYYRSRQSADQAVASNRTSLWSVVSGKA